MFDVKQFALSVFVDGWQAQTLPNDVFCPVGTEEGAEQRAKGGSTEHGKEHKRRGGCGLKAGPCT